MMGHMILRPTSAGAVALAALAAAGCGSSAPKTLTHQQLVQQADAICARASTQVKQIKVPTTLNSAEIAGFLGKIGPLATQVQQQLSALKPPSSDNTAYQRYLGDLSAAAASIGQLQTAAQQGNKQQVASALSMLQANRANADAKSIGLTSCGQFTA